MGKKLTSQIFPRGKKLTGIAVYLDEYLTKLHLSTNTIWVTKRTLREVLVILSSLKLKGFDDIFVDQLAASNTSIIELFAHCKGGNFNIHIWG